MEKEIKKRIKDALVSEDQPSLFGSVKSTEDLELACLEFLRFKGYKVSQPINYRYKVTKLDDLVHFFYTLLNSKHPEYINVYRNMGRDRAIAKRFVENRIYATGYGEDIALRECAEIIATVFEYEKDFKFRTDINFGMFGQKNLGWITEKAVNIINKKTTKVSEEKTAQRIAEIEIEQRDKYDLGFDDLDDILNRMEAEQDGKE